MTEDSTMSLKVTDTGSLSVNRYGWINIWTAILGHFFAQFPAFFEGPSQCWSKSGGKRF